MGYGIANWHYYNNNRQKAAAMWREIITGSHWPAFGLIASEADLAAMRQ